MGFLDKLKGMLGESSQQPAAGEADTSPFRPEADHPLAREHEMIAGSLQPGSYAVSSDTLERFKRLTPEEARRVAEAVIKSMLDQQAKTAALVKRGADYKVIEPLSHRAYALRVLLEHGARHGLPVSDPALLQWLEWSVSVYQLIPSHDVGHLFQMAEWCEGAVDRTGNVQPHFGRLEQLCRRFLDSPDVRRDHWKRLRGFRDRLGMTPEIHLGKKRRWSRLVTKDFESMTPATRLAWTRLFEHLVVENVIW